MVALPELDGASGPVVYAGQKDMGSKGDQDKFPIEERVGTPRRSRRPPRGAPPQAAPRAPPRHRAVQLPAERRRHRHGGAPRRVRLPAEHPPPPRRRRLRRGRPRLGRHAPRDDPRRQRERLRHRRQRARHGADRRSRARHPLARGDRGAVGAGTGQAPHRRARAVRARRAARQGHDRAAAGLRLRGRPDAPPVRGRLRAHPRLLGLLPLPPPHRRHRRPAALRHPRGARVHAGQAVGAVGRLLARAAGRRRPELLLLRGQQSLRGEHRQTAQRGDAGQLPDPGGHRSRSLPRSGRRQGRAAAVEVARRRRARRRGGRRAARPDHPRVRRARARARRRPRLLARPPSRRPCGASASSWSSTSTS